MGSVLFLFPYLFLWLCSSPGGSPVPLLVWLWLQFLWGGMDLHSCFSTYGCLVLSCTEAEHLCGVLQLQLWLDAEGLWRGCEWTVLPTEVKCLTGAWKQRCGVRHEDCLSLGFCQWLVGSDCLGMKSLQSGISTDERGEVLLLRIEEFGNFLNCLS